MRETKLLLNFIARELILAKTGIMDELSVNNEFNLDLEALKELIDASDSKANKMALQEIFNEEDKHSKDMKVLRETLNDDEKRSAFENVLEDALSGFAHSLCVMFDGGTWLTDHFPIDIINRDTGKSIIEDIALHEYLFEYIDKEKQKH